MLKKLPNPITITKRLTKTASVAGLSALRVAKGEKPDATLLKETFEQLGTTYIKLGQFIASTPSLFPKEYVLAFADCLDNTTPLHFDKIKAVLDDEFAELGGTDQVFAKIDKRPLASASIAQVHKAWLHTGETVAIKVQKPEVATIIHTDLSVLHGSFWVLEKTVPAFKFANLAPIISEIKSRMLAETDFVAERTHLDNFHKFINNLGDTRITAPKVYHAFSTKKVLTMEFFDGVSLVDETALAAISDPKAVMGAVLDTWFMSLLATGEFHADLHAGNLLLLKDGRIGFLDFGLVGAIKPEALKACMDLVSSLQVSDYQGMAGAMIQMGMTTDTAQQDRLAKDLQNLLGQNTPFSNNARQNAQNLNALMVDLVEVGKRHGIHFPKDFALLTKQLLYFDRFMTTLAPDMELFEGERLAWLGD